jgi:uncharacterized protein
MFDSALYSYASFEGLDSLLQIYYELDQLSINLRTIPGLSCPKGCSHCCCTSALNIEVSVLEFIPLCLHLHSINKLNDMYDRIQTEGFSMPCIMLSQDTDVTTLAGGCTYYAWRPLICRLFGFSAVRDKYGKLRFSLCRVIKEKTPNLLELMQGKINPELSVPVNSELSLFISQLNPYLGASRYGINEALSRTIEYVGYKLADLKGLGINNDDFKPDRPSGRKIA